MGFEPQGGGRRGPTPQVARANVYALVIYVPSPLGGFLDDLRRDLVPDYNPRAHVSVLPPRPLAGDWKAAGVQVEALAEKTIAFEIELTSVEIFPTTDVIYLEVGDGSEELRRLHAAMAGGALTFAEPFAYKPHITLAQDILPEQVSGLHELAVRRWKEFPGARRFRAERAVFVHNNSGDCWVDLAEYRLGAEASPNGQRKI